MTNHKNSLLIGTIVGVHGIKGLVKIRSFLKNTQDLGVFKTIHHKDGSLFPLLKIIRLQGDIAIIHIQGINDRTKAELLKNTDLFIDRIELPPLEENTFYYTDLIGLEVRSLKGELLGTVINIQDFGASPLLEIKLLSQKESIFTPFRDEIIPLVDMENKVIQIDEEFINQLREPS